MHKLCSIALVLVCWPGLARAQLQLLPDEEPQCVFAGNARNITVLWRNAGDETADAEIHTRLYQASSAAAAPLNDTRWKQLQVLPHQTIVESATLTLPAVKAEASFLIQWLESTNRVIGTTEVLVYPTNLLAELKALTGDEDSLGVFDPNNRIKPLLSMLKVPFSNLENAGIATFRGKLAIVGPYESKAQMPNDLNNRIQTAARKGVAVVWICPPPGGKDKLQPSFYTVPEGSGCTVVAQTGTVAGLSENPVSQLNLLHFARLALRPEPARLPSTTQP